MRVVLDTGILIAALITKNTPPDLIYQAWRKKKFELITSEWQLSEFRRVSRYPKLRKYLIPAEAGNMINGLRYQALVLTDLPTLEVSQDPDDNPVLAMAVAGEADFLVSGDKRDLLALKIIEKTKIVTARNFLTEL
ncbi:MAG: putative toxin-antitoxin system toxin component, PIN family [Thiogranum sp.]